MGGETEINRARERDWGADRKQIRAIDREGGETERNREMGEREKEGLRGG